MKTKTNWKKKITYKHETFIQAFSDILFCVCSFNNYSVVEQDICPFLYHVYIKEDHPYWHNKEKGGKRTCCIAYIYFEPVIYLFCRLHCFLFQASLLKSVPMRWLAKVLVFEGISLPMILDWTNVSCSP